MNSNGPQVQVSSSEYFCSYSDVFVGDADLRKDLLSAISLYQDLYVTKQHLASRRVHREVVSLHILNHIMKYVSIHQDRASY